jgi:beta-carotene/zeaxanthin 4-ketolase
MGILIASIIIFLWGFNLFFTLTNLHNNFFSIQYFIHVILQTYLYTGLFITAHDSMHGALSKNKRTNNLFGRLSVFLFAGMSYKRLAKNHVLHHKFPGEVNDPDFNTGTQDFWRWWLSFLFRYTTLTQIVIMGMIYNILKLKFDDLTLWMVWLLPAFLSTLQLFYFGTYTPHKYPHSDEMKPHNARTLTKNHVWGMISCYFFGYHFEHHQFPALPWWQLYKTK